MCVCVRLKYHAVYLKPKQHCELTTLQLKRKKKKNWNILTRTWKTEESRNQTLTEESFLVMLAKSQMPAIRFFFKLNVQQRSLTRLRLV